MTQCGSTALPTLLWITKGFPDLTLTKRAKHEMSHEMDCCFREVTGAGRLRESLQYPTLAVEGSRQRDKRKKTHPPKTLQGLPSPQNPEPKTLTP